MLRNLRKVILSQMINLFINIFLPVHDSLKFVSVFLMWDALLQAPFILGTSLGVLSLAGILYYFHIRRKRSYILEHSELLDSSFSSLRQREKVFVTMFENANEAYMITDDQHRIIWINPAFVQITGYSKEEIIGQTPRQLSSGFHQEDFYNVMWQSIHEKGTWSGQLWNQHKDGEYYLIDLTIRRVKDDSSPRFNYVGTFRDITEYNQLEAELSYQKSHDQLTNLPMRTLLKQRFAQAKDYHAQSQLHIALLLLNIDQLHDINERYSFQVGDQILQQFAERLAKTNRASSTVSRLSGDEFVILLPDLRRQEDYILAIERIRKVVCAPYDVVKPPIEITFSTGVSFYPEHGEELDHLLKYASRAMHEAKESGPNQIRIATPLAVE